MLHSPRCIRCAQFASVPHQGRVAMCRGHSGRPFSANREVVRIRQCLVVARRRTAPSIMGCGHGKR
jgi:hypothetical protein